MRKIGLEDALESVTPGPAPARVQGRTERVGADERDGVGMR